MVCLFFKKYLILIFDSCTFGKIFDMSRTYNERKNSNKNYVLLLNCKVVGVWGNLKKLCDDMKIDNANFLSYSSLSKKKKDGNPIEFEDKEGLKYSVYVELIK